MKDDTDSSLQPTPGERRPSIGRRHALTGCRTPARTAAEAGELWTIDEVADCLRRPEADRLLLAHEQHGPTGFPRRQARALAGGDRLDARPQASALTEANERNEPKRS